ALADIHSNETPLELGDEGGHLNRHTDQEIELLVRLVIPAYGSAQLCAVFPPLLDQRDMPREPGVGDCKTPSQRQLTHLLPRLHPIFTNPETVPSSRVLTSGQPP